MNRQLWNSFIEQIDAQVKGDFQSLATEYETVTGHPFRVKSYTGNRLLFSMIEQAMETQHKDLLNHTITFISQLPADLQREYQVFTRRRVSPQANEDGMVELPKAKKANKFWDMLHLNHTA